MLFTIDIKLTNSQAKAIEAHKKLFSSLHPTAEYKVWQPRNSRGKVRLVATYYFLNSLGGHTQVTKSWEVGTHGKITESAIKVK